MLFDPSPKSQSQEVGVPVELSMNWTVCPSTGNLGPYVKATLRSLARVEARLAKKLFILDVVCAMVFIERIGRIITKGNTLAMNFIALRGGIGSLFMIFFSFCISWSMIPLIMIREGLGEIASTGDLKEDMDGIVVSHRGAGQEQDELLRPCPA